MSTGQGNQGDKEANHLRGIGGRGAEDAGHGRPRPDENQEAAERPPAIQATHGGKPTDAPLVEPLDDSGVGRDAVMTGEREPHGRGRAGRSNPDSVAGAFGEELPERK